ncbi:MAG: hypothetical protein HYV02_04840 [Deltaproteobacteria bacterium]|nr:hypothetical protein [Deltaproteobacteria bacterium]
MSFDPSIGKPKGSQLLFPPAGAPDTASPAHETAVPGDHFMVDGGFWPKATAVAGGTAALEPDHAAFSELSNALSLYEAKMKLLQNGTGQTMLETFQGIRATVERPGLSSEAALPAVPLFRDLMQFSEDAWKDAKQRPSLLRDIEDHYRIRRDELRALITEYQGQLQGSNYATTEYARDMLGLLKDALLRLDAEIGKVHEHRTLYKIPS